MGLSASQARLLSITARLSNNELSSQLITNSKVRLATESQKASDEYLNALNATKLGFVHYDDKGAAQIYDLTPALIYSYEPLKNQYAIQNAQGKNLVTALDAKNFENTNTLHEFLDCYGLLDYTSKVSAEKEYAEKMKQYELDLAEYQKEYQDYINKMKVYEEEYAKWLENKDKPNLHDTFVNVVGTSDAPKSCYNSAKTSGNLNCYEHLLEYLIDYTYSPDSRNPCFYGREAKFVKDSLGREFWTTPDYAALDSSTTVEEKKTFEEISKLLDTVYCDGYDDDGYKTNAEKKYNLLLDKKQKGETITQFDRLTSDYLENADGSYSLKTLRQKAVDMYSIIEQNLISSSDKEGINIMLDNFTDGDMKNIAREPKKPIEPKEPKKPTEPPLEVFINDKEKGQWYINLWHMMNGSYSANILENAEDTDFDYPLFMVPGAEKDLLSANYAVILDEQLSDASWLQYALDNGIVTLKKTQYYDPSADSGKIPELEAEGIMWNDVVYSNSEDIREVEDTQAIAIAQAKYEKTLNEIEAKDNKYDTDLKNLDTIHNALQTEYESVKNVISKNVERSFKAFS